MFSNINEDKCIHVKTCLIKYTIIDNYSIILKPVFILHTLLNELDFTFSSL